MATDQDYRIWIGELKSKFRQAQLAAAIKVNSTLLAFYWELGADIVAKQQHSVWGEGFLSQLSQDLMAEFPEVKGFSVRSLKYIRQWRSFYHHSQAIGQQAVAQLCQIPWGHNIASFPRSRVGMQTDPKPLYTCFAAPECLVSDLTNDCRVLVPYAFPRGSVGTRNLEIFNYAC
ncbi:MAG: DUF1016 N-terminal domain-containing protein [Methylobacter sp.]|jgi:hypothetical protein